MNGRKSRALRQQVRGIQYDIFHRLGYTEGLEPEDIIEQIVQMDGQTMSKALPTGYSITVCTPFSFKWVLKRLKKGVTLDQMIQEGTNIE